MNAYILRKLVHKSVLMRCYKGCVSPLEVKVYNISTAQNADETMPYETFYLEIK